LGSGGRSISAVLAASLAVLVHDDGIAKWHASQASGPFHLGRLVGGKRGVVSTCAENQQQSRLSQTNGVLVADLAE
jgi:hypothetical protein